MNKDYNELPAREQPANRLREVGPRAVSDIELLACLLQGRDAKIRAESLVREYQTLERLARATEEELTQAQGIGPAQVARIHAAFELGRRLVGTVNDERFQVRGATDVALVVSTKIGTEEREAFVVVVLDTRNRVLHTEILYRGTVNATVVRCSEVFMVAMRHNGNAIAVGHNHPSGDVTPSPEDVTLTRQLASGGKLLEIQLIDHVVVGRGGAFYSMREHGLGFER